MAKYRCLRACVWRTPDGAKNDWVAGDIYEGDEPKCGKGTSLVTGKKPLFVEVKGDEPEPEPKVKPEDGDPRTDDEIRAALLADFDYKAHPRMKRSTMLSKEEELRQLKGMDADWN